MTPTPRQNFCRVPEMCGNRLVLFVADCSAGVEHSGQPSVTMVLTHWATLTLVAIMFTQYPLKALFRGAGAELPGQTALLLQRLKHRLTDFAVGMIVVRAT